MRRIRRKNPIGRARCRDHRSSCVGGGGGEDEGRLRAFRHFPVELRGDGRSSRRGRSRSSWVPICATRPWSRTMTRSALRSVLRRWATMKVVRPAIADCMAWTISCSVSASMDAVGIVQHQDRGIQQHGARDRQPLALPAGEPAAAFAQDGVVALRQLEDEVVRRRRCARPSRSARAWRPATPKAIFAATVVLKRKLSWNTRPTLRRGGASSRSRISTPSISSRPFDGIVKTRDQREQRRFARAGRAHDRDALARLHLEADILEHGLGARDRTRRART